MNTKTVTIGIISDTHMPQRWNDIPESVFEIFADVDLILHAGDVGELWVTDKLAEIAPVIAVHGNDESDAARAAFPYQQMLTIAGHRLLLTHSHYPDRATEMAKRLDDSWHPKLAHLHSFAAPHDATILVYGHTHIPMNYMHDGILLLNAGAIASGNATSRMTVQSVAKLVLSPDETPQVTHYDLNTKKAFTPVFDIDGGFKAAHAQFSEVFFTDDLLIEFNRLRAGLTMPEKMQVLKAMMPLLHECWYHGKATLSLAEMQAELAKHPAAEALVKKV
ncbi:MAG: metallophosphoesterase family protein [Aggregatilineales bacterium]